MYIINQQARRRIISTRSIRSMTAATISTTCDIYDKHESTARVPSVQWKSYGGSHRLMERKVVTLQCYEDNSRVKELLSTPEYRDCYRDHVLVIDGGGSLQCSLLGDQLAQKAVEQGWAGILVFGAVRDVEILRTLPLLVFALGCTPRKSVRQGKGSLQNPVEFGGIVVRTGDTVYCDENGVVFL